MTPDDAESDLIDGLHVHNPQAIATAYDRYAQRVYSLFFRITRDRAVAEDLVQELFLKLWNRGQAFDPSKGGLGTWILTIARNMGLDYVRSAQARFSSRVRPITAVDHVLLSCAPKTPDVIIENANLVRRGFELLTPDQRHVLELAYFEGLSQTEIAARINEPLGTVKSWMRSGLAHLRSSMKGGVTK